MPGMSAGVLLNYVVSEQGVQVSQNLQLSTDLVMSHQGLILKWKEGCTIKDTRNELVMEIKSTLFAYFTNPALV